MNLKQHQLDGQDKNLSNEFPSLFSICGAASIEMSTNEFTVSEMKMNENKAVTSLSEISFQSLEFLFMSRSIPFNF